MSPIELALTWVLSIVVAIAPPGRKVYYPEAVETVEEGQVRLADLAGDIVEIVYNPDATPVFRGSRGRSRTASLILAIMTNESGFRKDVDFNLGKYGRGDGGRSWCLMQLRVSKKRTIRWNYVEDRIPHWGDNPADIFDGYYGHELVQDRRRCISEGLKMMRSSIKACRRRGNPMNASLAGYVKGKCEEKEGGWPGSIDRFQTAARWYHSKLAGLEGWTDQEVVNGWAEWQAKRHRFVISSKASTNDSRDAQIAAQGSKPTRKAVQVKKGGKVKNPEG